MEQQQNAQPQSTTYKTFGIISLILGIVAFLFSFIPCLGMYAIFPGILGIVLGVIGFVMANKVNGAKGMVIAGIVLSVLGTAVAYFQYSKLKGAVKEVDSILKDSSKMNDLKNSIKALDSTMKELDSIK
ncbi:DUF4190 domain-containing protein [Ferruginibacter sp. SUN002]|uniref:DUF4190 domain-containing protein n=1 Tax=Ferruginibacter sp. SUN002 TaxID=2937789 RepID=UPI003D363E53